MFLMVKDTLSASVSVLISFIGKALHGLHFSLRCLWVGVAERGDTLARHNREGSQYFRKFCCSHRRVGQSDRDTEGYIRCITADL